MTGLPIGTEKCGFLGVGAMGRPMARALLTAGVPVKVWNRTAAKTLDLVQFGAEQAEHPSDAALPVVLTMLTDLPQLRQVLDGDDGLLAGWRRSGVADPLLAVMGTVDPTAVAELAAEARLRHGVRLVDAPVSGGVLGAEQGRLSIFLGGAPDDVTDLLPYLRPMATRIGHLGPVGSGALGKACNQLIVAGTIAAISESMLLAARSGLDTGALLELLNNGLAGSELLRQKGRRWVEGDFSPSGSARNQLKDLEFALSAARVKGLDLPTTIGVRNLYQQMVANGDGDLDHTGLYRLLAGAEMQDTE